jgi:hypothetical protein
LLNKLYADQLESEFTKLMSWNGKYRSKRRFNIPTRF